MIARRPDDPIAREECLVRLRFVGTDVYLLAGVGVRIADGDFLALDYYRETSDAERSVSEWQRIADRVSMRGTPDHDRLAHRILTITEHAWAVVCGRGSCRGETVRRMGRYTSARLVGVSATRHYAPGEFGLPVPVKR